MAQVKQEIQVASGLSTEDDECQVCTLLYCLGKEAEDVLKSTNITEDEWKVRICNCTGEIPCFFQSEKKT